MPGDGFRKLATGQAFDIRAAVWNRLTDLARDNDLGKVGAGAVELTRETDIIKVRNDTGADVGRFAALGLGDPLILPADNLPEFQRLVAFSGHTPRVPGDTGRFCITVEPLAKGTIGRAMVAGVVCVQLHVQDVLWDFADVLDGDATQLQALNQGSAQVLWVESSGSPRWAVVRLCCLDVPGVLGSGSGPTPLCITVVTDWKCDPVTGIATVVKACICLPAGSTITYGACDGG